MFYKNIVKPLYYYLKNKNLREFYRLCDKCGHCKRYKAVDKVKFLSYQFYIQDIPSFVRQFKELFVNHSYNLKTENKIVKCYLIV